MSDSQLVELKCPKCLGTMRAVERSGVVIDICEDCRGIFLDRGELERLMDSESKYLEQQSQPSQPSQPRSNAPMGDFFGGGFGGGHGGGHGGEHGGGHGGGHGGEHGGGGYGGGHDGKRRRGFLGELFD